MMTRSYITDLHTHKYEESFLPDVLNKVPNVPQACDSAKKYQLHSLNKSKDSNMLSKTNNTTHAKGINLSSQENQDDYNQHNQQFITCKYEEVVARPIKKPRNAGQNKLKSKKTTNKKKSCLKNMKFRSESMELCKGSTEPDND